MHVVEKVARIESIWKTTDQNFVTEIHIRMTQKFGAVIYDILIFMIFRCQSPWVIFSNFVLLPANSVSLAYP